MKRLFLFLVFTSFSGVIFAQADSVKLTQLKNKLIDTICTCMTQTDTTKLQTSDDIQTQMMSCFMTDGMGVFMEYLEATGIDISDSQQLQKLGQKIGIELSYKCPTVMKLMLRIAKDSPELKQMMQGDNKSKMETMPSDKKDSTSKGDVL
jgi:hypothetical protein